MTLRERLFPLACFLFLALPLALSAQDSPPDQAGGTADIAVQGYYLGGNSQPVTALSGLDISFREYLPKFGFLTGNLEGYADSSRGRAGNNSITAHDLRWKGRRWTITAGDYTFRTAIVPPPFTNYSYPELGARGAKLEMIDGLRQVTVFAGEETLREGPRITFRVHVPQFVTGASVEQTFGGRLLMGIRYLRLSSSQNEIAANRFFFQQGAEFVRTDSLSAQAAYVAGGGLTLWADATLSHEAFAGSAVFRQSVPFSSLAGARWKTKRVTVSANYGRLSLSALPVLGFFFGDRKGPYAEIRYKVFGSFELFGSALRSQNNLEKNPAIINFSTQEVTGGANVTLPGAIGLSGQYSKIGLRGDLPSDPLPNQRQRSDQSQVSANRTIGNHSLMLTARELNLDSQNFRQKQRSVELQDNLHFSRFVIGGAVRGQQQNSGGQLQNSVFVRGSGQARFKHFSIYGQFEAGNDLINKTLFATNTVNSTVAGLQIPARRGWNLQVEAFRTTLLSTLNPENILVLQTHGVAVADILNDFNQWSFFVHLSHRAQWGAALPEGEFASNHVVYGSIEGFVFEEGGGTQGVANVAIQMDKTRSVVTDATGRYRFEDVPEGAHAVAIKTEELAADYSPGANSPGSLLVKPRAIARADLRVVRAGSAIRGRVEGIAKDDIGTVGLDNVVINLVPSGKYTTCEYGGDFGFYNLSEGKYVVSLATASLPENYVAVSSAEVEVEVGSAAAAPYVVFRLEKRIKQLPVRRVFQSSAN